MDEEGVEFVNTEEESKWVNHLKEDLHKVEIIHDREAPPQYYLLNTLNEYKTERKIAFRRELIAFIIIALIILAFYFTIALKLATLFLWIQGIALFFIPATIIAEKKRRKNREEVTMF